MVLADDHPASPVAVETAPVGPSTTLALNAAPPAPPAELRTSAPAPGSTPATGPATQEAALYSCPMHPEVTSDKPGRCPKCGMKLTKKDAK
jgi:hypothetical protein